jgi:hypothetical protein
MLSKARVGTFETLSGSDRLSPRKNWIGPIFPTDPIQFCRPLIKNPEKREQKNPQKNL